MNDLNSFISRWVLLPRIWSNLVKFPCVLEKNVYYMIIGWNTLEYVFVQVDDSVFQVSEILLILYLLVLSITER